MLGSSSAPSSSLFEHTTRPYRDTAWGVIYVLSLVLALIGGVYALVHRYVLRCCFNTVCAFKQGSGVLKGLIGWQKGFLGSRCFPCRSAQ